MLKTKVYKFRVVLAAALLTATNFAFLGSFASAAGLTHVTVRFDRMATATATTGLVCAQPATTATEASVVVGFPTNTVVSTTLTNWGVSTAVTTGWPSGAVAWPGIAQATAADNTLKTATFPSTDLTVGTLYCFNWTNSAAITTRAAAAADLTGTVTTQDSVPATIESGTYATAVVGNDQIVVNATVPPTFNFAIGTCSSNIDNFTGNLSPSAVGTTTGCDVTVNTNAKTGWFAWAKDSNTGLTSVSASKTIASTTPGTNATLSSGSEGYVLGVTSITQGSGAGTTSATNAYGNGSGGTAAAAQGSGLDSTLRLIASSTGTASGAVFRVQERASISAITPAGTDYTDTITLTGAGSF